MGQALLGELSCPCDRSCIENDLFYRYSLLALNSTENVPRDKSGCRLLLNRLGLTDWALGYTKVRMLIICFWIKKI